MDKKTFNSRLSSMEDDINKLNNILFAIKITDIEKHPFNYEELSIDAAIRAERIACKIRNIVYATNIVTKKILMKNIVKVHGITIQYEGEVFSVTLPGILSKRRKHVNTNFLTDPLHYALDTYVKEHSFNKFKDCIVCFSHVYDRKLPDRRIRDYDNMECKQILDTIATFIMIDDTGLLCDAYHTTEFDDSDYTRVSIMPKHYFPIWLVENEYNIKTISDF